MSQRRRPLRSAPRTRSLAVGGALAALAVVGGGTVVAVSGPTDIATGDIVLTQNAPAQEMELGAPVDLDLEPVVAQAAGGTIPEGTTVQVTGLPDGLVQNGWVISGTPTRAGEYDVLITVSSSGEYRSERVQITVTEDGPGESATTQADESTTPGVTQPDDPMAPEGTQTDETTTAGESADPGGATTDDETTDSETTTPAGEVDPTLSAVPGRAQTADEPGDGTEAGDGADDAVAPEVCAIVGGEGEELDATAMAASLAPMLAGDDDDAGESGLTGVILNAVAGLLPSMLGESGSAAEAGSAAQLLCSLPLSLLGGAGGEEVDTTVPTGDGAEAATAQPLTTDGAGTELGAQAATAAGLSGLPAALVGLLGAESGSLDG